MTVHEPVQMIQFRERPSRIAVARDVAIILVCAAFLLGLLPDVFLLGRSAPDPRRAAPAASVSL